jgi:chromate transporter
VIIAVVVQAVWGLGRKALATPLSGATGATVLLLSFRGFDEVALLFGAALALPVARVLGAPAGVRGLVPASLVALAGSAAAASAPPGTAGATAGLAQLGLIFLKVGSILFGSGYVLLAFLRPDLVERTRWLTDGELLDAVAVGQFTPGPVLTTATFIGYLVAGAPGALVATIAIFLPSFVFVALSHPLVPRLRRSRWAGGFLDGANAASVALMARVAWELGQSAVVDGTTAGLAATAAILLAVTRVNSAWLVAGGALAGALRALAG